MPEFEPKPRRRAMNTDMAVAIGTPTSLPAPPPEVGERMVVVGKMLATSGEALIGSLRTPVRTSTDLTKAAGVNKDIASRFMSALAKRDPMAVAYYMPGVE